MSKCGEMVTSKKKNTHRSPVRFFIVQKWGKRIYLQVLYFQISVTFKIHQLKTFIGHMSSWNTNSMSPPSSVKNFDQILLKSHWSKFDLVWGSILVCLRAVRLIKIFSRIQDINQVILTGCILDRNHPMHYFNDNRLLRQARQAGS